MEFTNMIRKPLLLFVFVCVFCLAGTNAYSENTDPAVYSKDGGVYIFNKLAVRFRAENAGLTVSERARITADRIAEFVSNGGQAKNISSAGDATTGKVVAGDNVICYVLEADAEANNTTPGKLAAVWAKNIRSLLLMPPVKIEKTNIVIPLGESRMVGIYGSALDQLKIASSRPDVAKAILKDGLRHLEVTGVAAGAATIDLDAHGKKVSLKVIVKKYAGYVPDVLNTEVTGSPCPSSIVEYAARQAVMANAYLEPGATMKIAGIHVPSATLYPENSLMASARVVISGGDYLDFEKKTTVVVRNVNMLRDEAYQLFYSNDPERLLKYQDLFTGRIEVGRPTRLLYHHQNMIGKRARLIISLINPDGQPVSYRILKAVSRPMVDTVNVGYVAGRDFLNYEHSNVSVIETVPPQSRLVLLSDLMNYKTTSSGIIQIKQIDGNRSYIKITALQPDVDKVSAGTITSIPNTIVMKLSDHVYPSPVKNVDVDYIVGKKWAFVSIGKYALDDYSAEKKLLGNYGVTYRINVNMENPTEKEKKVIVAFRASAGLASGVFLVDGEIKGAKHAKEHEDVNIATYILKPGEVRKVNIITIPLAGSNYPAKIVVRS